MCQPLNNLSSEWQKQAKEWKATGIVCNIIGVFMYKEITINIETLPQ